MTIKLTDSQSNVLTRNGGSELKRAILDEARNVLLSQGYTDLSMRRIASAVGCTATSIYLYFKNKDAIFHALIDEGFEKLDRELRTALTEARSPAERMRQLCRRYLEFGLGNPEYYEVMFMLHPKHMERYPRESYRRARRNLESIAEGLKAAYTSEGLSLEELSVQATVIWASLHGTVSLLIAQRIDVGLDREAILEEAVDQATRRANGFHPPPSHLL